MNKPKIFVSLVNVFSLLVGLPLLGLSQAIYSAQVCKEYIPDETPDSRYEVSVDGTVLDLLTGLTWMQCTVGLSGENCEIGSATDMNWQEALQAAANTTFAGHSDWRLPNIEQLRSILAYNCHTPAINISIFPNTKRSIYFSSSPWTGLDTFGRNVFFESGGEGGLLRTSGFYVRLVR